MELFDSKYYRGQGALFLGERDAGGNPINLLFIGDLSSAELSPNVERGKVIENVSGAGAVAGSWLKRVEYGLSIAMRSIKRDHLAAALQGAATQKAANSVTDEAHTAKLGGMSPLAHTKVDTVVVTGVGGTPTYVENTDYKVHADEGLIEWLTGGTITDGTAALIDYNYAAQYHVSANPQNLDKYLVFAGNNTADNNKQTRCEVYKIRLDPGVLSLITDEAAAMSISGTVLQDTARTAGDQFFAWKVED